MTRRWYPSDTRSCWGPPPVGALLAHDHAVWRVTEVADLPLDDAIHDAWVAAGMPDIATWVDRPYRLGLDFVGGARPKWAPGTGAVPSGGVDIRDHRYRWGRYRWSVYPESGRWPQCSCCGEPMPCRAELQDREVAAGLEQVEKLVGRLPGCCWGCGEPITRRQATVLYPGENLDLPGGPEVRIHTRQACWGWAQRYERLWLAADPRRDRILTWPECSGTLIVHGDGSSECWSRRGEDGESDCQGHLSHDHMSMAACFATGLPCRRECSPLNHPGASPGPRPPRVQSVPLPG